MNALFDELFEPAPLTVFDDAEGGMRYWPGVIDAATSAQWFEALSADVDWQRQRRLMYDRIVDVPRLQAYYSLDALPSLQPLAGLLACVQNQVPAPYNSVGFNLYRNGRDSVAMHNDKLHMLKPHQPIALVSLGSTRRMHIRAKQGARKVLALDLRPGSLLVMSYASQLTHEHGIPKTPHSAPRMSVVFRVRPEGWVKPKHTTARTRELENSNASFQQRG